MGDYTVNNYFYKPGMGAYGAIEKALFDAALDGADAEIAGAIADIAALPTKAGIQGQAYISATSAGGTTVYTAGLSPALTAYAAKQMFLLLINATNTGASTLNIDSLGAKDWKKRDSTGALVALAAGDLVLNQLSLSVYDGTQFILLNPTPAAVSGGPSAASQSEQEAGTEAAKYVAPATAQYHPSAAKCWCKFQVDGTIAASYNVVSITDTGTGRWSVVIATDFSSVNYAVVVDCETVAGGAVIVCVELAGQAAGSVAVEARNVSNALWDPTRMYVACYGDQ